MATTKPRITVTLDPEHYAVLAEMSEVTKSPMSSIVAEIIGEAVPVFARVVKLIKEAEAAKGSVGDRVRELATEAELDMMPLAREALKTFDMFDDAIMKAIHDGRGDAGGGAASAVTAHGSPKAKGGSRTAKAGMKWWNALSEDERSYWMKVAGSAVPADAYAAFRRGTDK